MAVHKVLMSKEIEKQDVTTSEISGATHFDGNSDLEVKGDFKVKCKLGDSNKTPKKYRVAGFVAFNADYQGPKHHSPTHNWIASVENPFKIPFFAFSLDRCHGEHICGYHTCMYIIEKFCCWKECYFDAYIY